MSTARALLQRVIIDKSGRRPPVEQAEKYYDTPNAPKRTMSITFMDLYEAEFYY